MIKSLFKYEAVRNHNKITRSSLHTAPETSEKARRRADGGGKRWAEVMCLIGWRPCTVQYSKYIYYFETTQCGRSARAFSLTQSLPTHGARSI